MIHHSDMLAHITMGYDRPYPKASTVASFLTVSIEVAKFLGVKNKAPINASHIIK